MLKNCYILFILFTFSIGLFATSSTHFKRDSILNLLAKESNKEYQVNLYNKLAPLLINTPQQLIKTAEKAVKLGEEIKYTKGQEEALLFLGIGYCEARNFDSSLAYLTKALSLIDNSKNIQNDLICNNYLGITYEGKANYFKALCYYFHTLKLATKMADSIYILKSLNNIGVVYLIKKDYKLAEKFLNKAYLIANIKNQEVELINYNLATICLENSDFKNALLKYEMVLVADLKSNNLKNIAETYNNIGACYLGLKNLSQAEAFMSKAFKIREQINDKDGLRNSYHDLAELYIKTKHYNKAIIFLNKSLNTAQESNNKKGKVNVYETYIELYKTQNNFKKALEYTDLKDGILQEISTTENIEKLADLEEQSQLKQKAVEIEVADVKIKNETISKNLYIVSVLLALATFLFLGFTIYNIKKNNAVLKNNEVQLTLKNSILRKQNAQIIKSEELTKQALKTKANFIRNISHEIRTPLNAISGITTLLMHEKENFDSTQVQNQLAILSSANQNLITLVNNILNFNNLDTGNKEVNLTAFKMQKIISEMSEKFALKIENKGLEYIVNYNVSPDKCFKADLNLIVLVLSNLLNNAINFTEKGSVELSITEKDCSFLKSTICFKVSDTGIGIAEENHIEIFEAFAQADVSNTRKIEGAGLGLAIAKKTVEKLGGNIHIISEKGKGSSFYFDLNLDIIDDEFITQKIENTRTSLSGATILVVEDSKINAIILSQFLKKWGCNYTVAENGLIGLELVKNNHFDIIIMDLQMPEMDGITCTQEIRKLADSNKNTIPIIALTAAHEKTMRESAFKAGINDYILKPFEAEDLTNRLLKVLNQAGV